MSTVTRPCCRSTLAANPSTSIAAAGWRPRASRIRNTDSRRSMRPASSSSQNSLCRRDPAVPQMSSIGTVRSVSSEIATRRKGAARAGRKNTPIVAGRSKPLVRPTSRKGPITVPCRACESACHRPSTSHVCPNSNENDTWPSANCGAQSNGSSNATWRNSGRCGAGGVGPGTNENNAYTSACKALHGANSRYHATGDRTSVYIPRLPVPFFLSLRSRWI